LLQRVASVVESMADVGQVPRNIGLIGVGTIGSAVVRGLCSEGGPAPAFVLSPRGAAKAAALQSEFPDLVRIAADNQEVVNSTDCVILAVLGPQTEELCKGLQFRTGQLVVSLVNAFPLARLRELVSPAGECAIAVPLPAVARRQGSTLLMPLHPTAQAIFDCLGTCVAVEDEAKFKRMLCITALMGDFYRRQLAAQQWLVSHGVSDAEAAAHVGASYATFVADSAKAGAHTLQELVAEQTPGGLNEMVWKGQEADGIYEAICDSLDGVHHRLITGQKDAELTPAAGRKRRLG